MSRPAPLHLGETVDATSHSRTGNPVRIDPASLTTHCVIVGQTGSGKTGLGIAMIEEALLAGTPTILIDPKGDLTNLALRFPALDSESFSPWVDGAEGSVVAKQWTDGLASWGMGSADITALQVASDVVVWTPGSSAGRGLNLMGSLQAPRSASDPAMRADEVSSTVSGLLALVGIESDPLSGREHILLANLVERSWAAGQDLSLEQLVGQVFDPPIRKLGVLDLNTFYEPKDRKELALKLNGLLASPSFASWSAGEGLDIAAMLHDPATGKARASVITIAHLSDEERQFAVAKILSALITWMRAQSGTSSLRALLYIDEVLGYVPPTANPPTKAPVLTLVKQARAFGVGVVLATQNPVDVDYKVLSNATTWVVGRLQTERDRDRLLEGMRSASGATDIDKLSATISGLAKREFVLQRAGQDQPVTFTSRWAMSYLRGPLTGAQITALGPLGGIGGPVTPAMAPTQPAPALTPAATPAAGSISTPPASTAVASNGQVPPAPAHHLGEDESSVAPPALSGVTQKWASASTPWLDSVGGTSTSSRYSAAIAVRLSFTFDDATAGITDSQEWEAVVHPLGATIDVDAIRAVDHDDRDFLPEAPPAATYLLTDANLEDNTWWKAATSKIVDHVVATQTISVLRNEPLKLWARPGEAQVDFELRCDAAADERADAEGVKLRSQLEAKIDRVKAAIDDAERKQSLAEDNKKASRTDELIAGAGDLLGALLGGRRNARSIGRAVRNASGRRADSSRESARVEAATDLLAEKMNDLTELEQQVADELFAVDAKWSEVAAELTEVSIALEKTDVRVLETKLVWVPVS